MLEQKEKEDIKEMFNDYGWSLRDLSEEYGITIRDVKEIVGENGHEPNEETDKHTRHRTREHLSLNDRKERIKTQREAREAKEDRRNKTQTITDFRKNGCAIARCKKCGEPMYGIAEDEEGALHYGCEKCGWEDLEDEVCKDACCRRGFAHLIAQSEDVDIDEEDMKEWVKTGK